MQPVARFRDSELIPVTLGHQSGMDKPLNCPNAKLQRGGTGWAASQAESDIVNMLQQQNRVLQPLSQVHEDKGAVDYNSRLLPYDGSFRGDVQDMRPSSLPHSGTLSTLPNEMVKAER
jgi:hypothetical protein